MFGKKQKRIKELENKIDYYIYREIKLKREIKEDKNYIETLLYTIKKIKQDTKTLKQLREEQGLTQKQVAEKIGTKSAYYISQVERGNKVPSFKIIIKLASLYKTTPARIVESITKDRLEV